jgi:hypothetical protein
VINANGSVDLYISRTAPAALEKNWLQTIPGRTGYTCLRLYSPLEPWFDQTWRSGEIERINECSR